jgi:hypothetical protein
LQQQQKRALPIRKQQRTKTKQQAASQTNGDLDRESKKAKKKGKRTN